MLREIRSDRSESIWDIAVRYGGLEAVLRTNIGLLTSDGLIPVRSQYRVGDVQEVSELQRYSAKSEKQFKRQDDPYRSNVQQTFWDVALMNYGDIDGGIAILLAENPSLINENGSVEQFRVSHKVKTKLFADARKKRLMLELVPATGNEALGIDNEFWITDDGFIWWTENEEGWQTDY